MYGRVKWLSTDVSEVRAASTTETSVDNYFTRQYILEDNSERQKMAKKLEISNFIAWNEAYEPETYRV
jgi:hypothetical protein